MPFVTKPGAPYVPLDFTLGLPAIKNWPRWEGDPPWILDAAEHPKPNWTECPKQNNLPPQEDADPGSTDDGKRKRRRKKKKHHRPKKAELKVTTWGVGEGSKGRLGPLPGLTIPQGTVWPPSLD